MGFSSKALAQISVTFKQAIFKCGF